jgi:hypothetical protein
MKKGTIYSISAIAIFCILLSCNSEKSMQELLQEEKKAIERFIDRNDLVILKEYPKDGVFKEKEYYRTNEGLFFHVVDSGNGLRVKYLDDVTVRFEYLDDVKTAARGDTTAIVRPSLYYPFVFQYGVSQTYSISGSPVCSGWIIPLLYVGKGAVVDLIIPSSLGSSGDYNNITPVFYKNLRYTNFN